MFENKKIFLLLATQRSGSTMICEDLRNTGVMGTPEEYFIPWDIKKNMDWKKALQGVVNKASTENGICSIKIMANQIPCIEACLADCYKGELDIDSDSLFPYFTAVFSDAKPIVIRRQNTLRQAISRHISRNTGIAHATENEKDEHFAGRLMKGYNPEYNNTVNYSYESIKNEVSNIANENIILSRVVEDLGVNRPLELYYEQIVRNGFAYLNRVSNYMDIEEYEVAGGRKMVRLSNNKNKELYNLYLSDYINAE